MGQPK